MSYLKISELFKLLSNATPETEEYYKLIRIIDSELNNIAWNIRVTEAKKHKGRIENDKQYKLF